MKKKQSVVKHLKHDIAEAKKSIAEDKSLLQQVKKRRTRACGKKR